MRSSLFVCCCYKYLCSRCKENTRITAVAELHTGKENYNKQAAPNKQHVARPSAALSVG